MSHVTHIRSDEARRVHAELVAALGTETVPHQWMTFMRTVREQLPAVLSKGRPTKAAIDASPIGALGFSSWRAMCEAPVDNRGLGLPWSTWRQWSRAWTVVQQHPGLQGAPLTAAEVNRLATEAKASGEPMPADMASVEAFQARQTARKHAAREETQAALKSRLEALEADLMASREAQAHTAGVVDQLREQLAAAQARQEQESDARRSAESGLQQTLADLQALQQQHEQLQASLAQADEMNRQLQQANQHLEQDLDEYRDRTLLGRILAVFSP